MKYRIVWSALGSALMVILITGTSALAVGNLKVGLVEINPKLALTGGVDDNVFLNYEDEKADEFGIITPGINFTLEKEDHYFNLGYTVDIIRYEEYDSQDSENHSLFGNFDFNFPGVFIKLNEIYQDTSDYATSELVDRVDRKQNNGNASIGAMFSDNFALQLDYLSEYHKYKPTEYRDLNRFIQEFGPGLYITLLPKTSAILEYHYGVVSYFDARDDDTLDDSSSKFHQVMGGVQWDITGKSTGTLKAGYQWKNYNDNSNLDGSKKNDKDTWVVSGEMEVNFTPKTSASIQLKRGIVESSFADNDYYVENMGSVRLTQKLLGRVSIKLGADYYYNSYGHRTVDIETGDREKRRDNILSGNIGLVYKIQEWLTVGADYKNQTRDSNSTVESYKDNQGSVYVSVVF